VVDRHLQNEANGWVGSGGNPWHLDKDTESYEFLTNMGDKPVRIGFKVWADGQIFYLGSLELVPHETRMIDLRKLRDAQETDLEKHQIPAGATDGSVLWLRLDNVPVMGRLAVITRHGGMASSYDCCLCGCPGQYGYTLLIPVITCPITVAVGDQVHGQVWYSPACGGAYYYFDMTTSLGWSSTNTNVFTLNNSNLKGLLTGIGGGAATALAQGTTACQAWYMMGAVCQCSSWVPIVGNTPCSVQNPTITVTRQSLTSTSATGSPSSAAANPAFTYAAAAYGGGGGNIASYTTQNPNANPNTASINAPSNPGGSVVQGGYAILTATYNTSGGSPFVQFYVPTFGLSCYNTQLETDYISGGACTQITIYGTLYSGTDTNPSGLPAGTYCDAFLGMVRLNVSGLTANGTKIAWVSGSKPNWTFQVITQYVGADGTAVVANQTLARDRSIIPKTAPSITFQLPGGSYAANDIGQGITLYILDIYKGIGNSVCSGFSNSIVVGACSPSTPTALCPRYAIE